MKTATKHIKTLAELREAKRELKMKIALADRNAKKSFLFSTFNGLVGKVEESSAIQQSILGKNVYKSMNFLSDKASERLNLGKTAKTILAIAVIASAPIIAKKIQDFIDDYR